MEKTYRKTNRKHISFRKVFLERQEMQKIRVKIEAFREDVRSFRAEFLERCPFGSAETQSIAEQNIKKQKVRKMLGWWTFDCCYFDGCAFFF